MVAVLEVIRIDLKQRCEYVTNAVGEVSCEVILDSTYAFEEGKIYGVVCEQGEGGEFISALLTGRVSVEKEMAYIDHKELSFDKVQERAWYVGKKEYGLWKREISARRALNRAINKQKKYKNIDEVIEQFGLTVGRLPYKISSYSGEKWRASLAIGYVSQKQIFCFPWMNTALFNHIMLSSGVYRFFKKMKSEGKIIILPTSRKENIEGIVDDVIEINNPAFHFLATDNENFKHYF